MLRGKSTSAIQSRRVDEENTIQYILPLSLG